MKTLRKPWVLLCLLLVLVTASIAEARVGGGRSSGSRGFRSFGTRSQPIAPSRPMQQPNYQNPSQSRQGMPYGANQPAMGSAGSGSFMRGLAGGLAGGFIGSMLFRNSGYANGGAGGGGGFGLLELLLVAGLGYWLFKRFASRPQHQHAGAAYRSVGEMSHYDRLRSVPPGPFAAQPEAATAVAPDHELAQLDPRLDIASFKEARMDDFVSLQAAWNHRDLASVAPKIAPELKRSLESDIAELKASGLVNRVENIAVRGADLVEAWAERGNLYATLRFRANLTDYTVSESTGQVVSGDRATPIRFEEDWTFVRDLDGPSDAWKVSAIEA